jgi:hypothetical protein
MKMLFLFLMKYLVVFNLRAELITRFYTDMYSNIYL